eukprot:gene18677-20563_t
MNILPKKRWHVRNKDNVARVRRDEQRAKEGAAELEKRNQLAEKEAAINSLRSKLPKGKLEEDSPKSESKSISISNSSGHINFFQDLEDQTEVATRKSNPEYEAERKAEQETYEKKLGILTYLGQSVSKKEGEGPAWYLQSTRKRPHQLGADNKTEDRRKDLSDPLQDVRKYLKKMKKKEEKDSHRKSKKSKYKELIKSTAKPSSSNIEELRAKRLKREQDERRKAEELVREKTTGVSSKKSETSYDPSRDLFGLNTICLRTSQGKMANLQRLSSLPVKRLLARSFSLAPRVSTNVMTEPAPYERAAAPAEMADLETKEKGPWTELSKEDKVALYKQQFPVTYADNLKVKDSAQVAGGVLVGVAVAIVFFAYCKTKVGPEKPRTITEEWRQKAKEKRSLYKQNPITGGIAK